MKYFKIFFVFVSVFVRESHPISINLELAMENTVEDSIKTVIEALKPRVATSFVIHGLVNIGGKTVYHGEMEDFTNSIIYYLQSVQNITTVLFKPDEKQECIDLKCMRNHSLRYKMTPKLIILIYRLFNDFFKSAFPLLEKFPTSYFLIITLNTTTNGISSEHGSKLKEIWHRFRIKELFFAFLGYEKILVFSPFNFEENNILVYSAKEFKKGYYSQRCNFRKHPLNITIFRRSITMEIKKESEIFDHLKADVQNTQNICGLDGFVMGNMVNYLNFTPVIVMPLDAEEFGNVYSNGTFTGAMLDLAMKRADISMNSRFQNYYGINFRFTQPIYDDEFCLIAPKSKIIPNWIELFLTLTPDIYIVFFSICLFMSFVWWCINKKLDRGLPLSFSDTVFTFFNTPLSLALWNGDKVLIITCIAVTGTFSLVFQAFMRTGCSAPSYYKDINTLKEADESGFGVALSSAYYEMFGGPDLSATLMKIKNKNVSAPSPTLAQVNPRKIFSAQRKNDMKVIIKLNYSDIHGNPTLHIVKECPRTYLLSYMVYEDFPYMECVDRFISRIMAGGFHEKWYEWSVISALQKGYRVKTPTLLRKLNFDDLQGGFYVLFCGVAVAFIIFALEVFAMYRKKNNQIQTGIPFTV